jgi:hypothetical protein
MDKEAAWFLFVFLLLGTVMNGLICGHGLVTNKKSKQAIQTQCHAPAQAQRDLVRNRGRVFARLDTKADELERALAVLSQQEEKILLLWQAAQDSLVLELQR